MSDGQKSDQGLALQGQSGWADLAAVLASRGFADRAAVHPQSPIDGHPDEEPLALLVRWLRPSWSRRLRRIDDSLTDQASGPQLSQSLDRLRHLHHAQSKIDLDRVHPTWWVRAIREESPAVQRLVAAIAPESIRAAIQSELLLDNQDLASDRPPAPEVVEWVKCLWAERLVGDEPDHGADSPAIIVLTRLSPRQGYRVCRLMGSIKLVISNQLDAQPSPPLVKQRIESIQQSFHQPDLRIEVLTRRDVHSIDSADIPRHFHAARIGLLSLARILADCEPYRVRWALQHWPYPIAKLIRNLMSREARGSAGLLQWESRILKIACDRLTFEGAIPNHDALTLPTP